MTRDAILRELGAEYAARRAENARREEQRLELAGQKKPDILKAVDTRREIIFAGMRSALKGQQLHDVEPKMREANTRIRRLLTEAGLPEDYLQPIYDCPTCQDTGYVGEPVRNMCACLKTSYYRLLYQQVGLSDKNPPTFEGFDLNVFPDQKLPGYGQTQRELMAIYRSLGEAYANTFPNTAQNDMLLMGHSGLGKTFLLQAIAHRVLDSGFNVMCVSAYRVIEIAREAHFHNAMAQMAPLITADLLLIDDLGVEPLMENITIPHLFNLINERQTAGRHTIYSTNLSKDELWNRYTERIASRLFDPKQTCVLPFMGEDVRRHDPRKGEA